MDTMISSITSLVSATRYFALFPIALVPHEDENLFYGLPFASPRAHQAHQAYQACQACHTLRSDIAQICRFSDTIVRASDNATGRIVPFTQFDPDG